MVVPVTCPCPGSRTRSGSSENKPITEDTTQIETSTVQGRDSLVAPPGSEQASSLVSSTHDRSAAGVVHLAPVVPKATNETPPCTAEKKNEALSLLQERLINLVKFVLEKNNVHKEI